MSTLKATNLQHASSSTANVVLAADGSVNMPGVVSGGLPYPNRNLLYNGAMQVAQRGTSVAGITGGYYYTADRWSTSLSTLGTWTQSIEADAPTGSGFRKSLKMLCTTNKTPGASDVVTVNQPIEGQDLQRIAKGTSSAQQLTLSFWVKSNVIGTYIAELYDNDNARQVSAAYTINSSATWERKVITFPADLTGALDNDNNSSLHVFWWLGAGSSFTSGTLNTAWNTTTNANRTVGQTNLAAAVNNYWQITGVQLEVGPVATPFEFKSYGQELRECQRYYLRLTSGGGYSRYANGSWSGTNTIFNPWFPFPVRMRTAPSSVGYLDLRTYDGTNILAVSAVSLDGAADHGTLLAVTTGAATAYRPGQLIANNTTNSYVEFSAEL